MTKTNFHTHTYRCGHAVGNEQVMVEAAIKNNIEILGFSCHVPLPNYRGHLLKGIFRIRSFRSLLALGRAFVLGGPAMRMPYSHKEEHQTKIQQLKKQKKEEITIYQGFEAEYFEEYLPYYQNLLDKQGVDYLILGNHFDKYSIHDCYYGNPNITDAQIIKYKEDVLHALDTDLFSYIAHPDLFMIGKRHWDSLCQEVAREICLKAKEKDVPLEINGGGMRRGLQKIGDEMQYPYPNTHFFKVASEVGNTVVFGVDAHSPEDFNDEIYIAMEDFASALHLVVVDTFTFKKGKH